jgi:hypothetical protein
VLYRIIPFTPVGLLFVVPAGSVTAPVEVKFAIWLWFITTALDPLVCNARLAVPSETLIIAEIDEEFPACALILDT